MDHVAVGAGGTRVNSIGTTINPPSSIRVGIAFGIGDIKSSDTEIDPLSFIHPALANGGSKDTACDKTKTRKTQCPKNSMYNLQFASIHFASISFERGLISLLFNQPFAYIVLGGRGE